MKKDLEARLKMLEKRYGPEVEPNRVTSVRWITAEDWRRGVRPGVYEIAAGDKSYEPGVRSFIMYIRYASRR